MFLLEAFNLAGPPVVVFVRRCHDLVVLNLHGLMLLLIKVWRHVGLVLVSDWLLMYLLEIILMVLIVIVWRNMLLSARGTASIQHVAAPKLVVVSQVTSMLAGGVLRPILDEGLSLVISSLNHLVLDWNNFLLFIASRGIEVPCETRPPAVVWRALHY